MKRANNSHTTTSSTLHTILQATCFLTATKEGEAAETTTSLVKTGKKNRDFFNVKLGKITIELENKI